jgi:hypothetical protein
VLVTVSVTNTGRGPAGVSFAYTRDGVEKVWRTVRTCDDGIITVDVPGGVYTLRFPAPEGYQIREGWNDREARLDPHVVYSLENVAVDPVVCDPPLPPNSTDPECEGVTASRGLRPEASLLARIDDLLSDLSTNPAKTAQMMSVKPDWAQPTAQSPASGGSSSGASLSQSRNAVRGRTLTSRCGKPARARAGQVIEYLMAVSRAPRRPVLAACSPRTRSSVRGSRAHRSMRTASGCSATTPWGSQAASGKSRRLQVMIESAPATTAAAST